MSEETEEPKIFIMHPAHTSWYWEAHQEHMRLYREQENQIYQFHEYMKDWKAESPEETT